MYMIVLKSRISQLIKKERARERKQVSAHYEREMAQMKREMEQAYAAEKKELKRNYKNELVKRERQIKRLQLEIDRNYTTYQEIRNREKHLDELTNELERVMESMFINVQESTQPFLRARSKVEAVRNRSARDNKKVERIFRVAR